MTVVLGAIADDFTGATDLASTWARQGLRVVQTIGVPDDATVAEGAEAIVVALKSRTAPTDEAVAESLAAHRWLKSVGAQQIVFKYCSTFDSTPTGNIGPVADALLEETGDTFTRVPRLSYQPADGLPGVSLCGNPTSVGQSHEAPSTYAHARLQPDTLDGDANQPSRGLNTPNCGEIGSCLSFQMHGGPSR